MRMKTFRANKRFLSIITVLFISTLLVNGLFQTGCAWTQGNSEAEPLIVKTGTGEPILDGIKEATWDSANESSTTINGFTTDYYALLSGDFLYILIELKILNPDDEQFVRIYLSNSSSSSFTDFLDVKMIKNENLSQANRNFSLIDQSYEYPTDYEIDDTLYRNCNSPFTEIVNPPLQKLETQKTSLKKDLKKKTCEGEKASPSRVEAMRERFSDIAEFGMVIPEKRNNVLDNLYDYPPDVQDIIKEFCRRWRKVPPPKKVSSFAKWIKDAREIKKYLHNANVSAGEAFEEAHYIYMTPWNDWEDRDKFKGRFQVKDIGSVTGLVWDAISGIATGQKKLNVKTYVDADGNVIEWQQ